MNSETVSHFTLDLVHGGNQSGPTATEQRAKNQQAGLFGTLKSFFGKK